MVARIVWGHNAERVRSLPFLLAGLAAGALVSQTLVWAAATGRPVLLWVAAAGLGATATGWWHTHYSSGGSVRKSSSCSTAPTRPGSRSA